MILFIASKPIEKQEETEMSQTSWSTSGYGVDEDIVQKINTENAWAKFIEFYENTDKPVLDEITHTYFNIPKAQIPKVTDWDDEDKDTVMQYFYEKKNSLCIPFGTMAVLADLVARNLNIPFDAMVIDSNESGNMIIAVPEFHPWEVPSSIKNASEEKYKIAFIDALDTLSVQVEKDDIDKKAIENWG